jgi:hypothetical protein
MASFDFSHQIEGACGTDEVLLPGQRKGTLQGVARIFHDIDIRMELPGRRQQDIEGEGPLTVWTGEKHPVGQGKEPLRHRAIVLITQDTEEQEQPAAGKIVLQRPAEGGHPGRIMGAIHKQHRRSLENLQTSFPSRPLQTFGNGTPFNAKTGLSDQLHGAQRQSGIFDLMPPRERADKALMSLPDAAV